MGSLKFWGNFADCTDCRGQIGRWATPAQFVTRSAADTPENDSPASLWAEWQMTSSLHRILGILPALAILAGAMGCQLMNQPGRHTPPSPLVPQSVPKELNKTILPDYIIEPPDVLAVSAVSLIPHQPYHLRPLDVLRDSGRGTAGGSAD